MVLHHQALAELYDQENGIQRTITLTQRKGKVITDADRKVNPQHLDVINVRKLNCLPHHLFMSNNKERLAKRCLLNYEWISTKIQAVGIPDVFNEYVTLAESELLAQENDVQLFCQFLELCYDAFKIDPNMFASHLIERLNPYTKERPAMKELVDAAHGWIEKTKAPLLLPNHNLQLLGLDSPLRFSIIAGSHGVFTPDKEHVVCVWDEHHTNISKIQVVALASKDVITTLQMYKVSPVCTSADSKFFYYIDNARIMGVECETGDSILDVNYIPDEFEKYTPRCMASSEDGRYIALGTRTGKPKSVGKNAWKQGSFIALFDASDMSQGPVATYNLIGKRHVDNLIFVDNCTQLLIVTRSKVTQMSVPDLTSEHGQQSGDAIFGQVCNHMSASQMVVFGVKPSNGAKIAMYNYAEKSMTFGSTVHTKVKEPESVEPFSVIGKQDASLIILGSCQSMRNARSTRIWLYRRTEEETEDGDNYGDITQISVGWKEWKHGISLCVGTTWAFVYVGWSNGDISLVDLNDRHELYTVHAHGHSVNMIELLDGGTSLLTMGSDQALKVWNWEALHSKSHLFARDEEVIDDGIELPSGLDEVNPVKAKTLDADEQCLGLQCTDDYVITAPHLNRQAPQFWRISDGTLDVELTKRYEVMYQQAYIDSSFNYESRRTHAGVNLVGDYLIYKRQRRSLLTLFVTKDIANPLFVAYDHFKDPPCFFHYITDMEIPGVGGGVESPLIIIVLDGFFEIRDVSLNILRSIEIPKISSSIGSMESSAAKRKLLLYRLFMTVDSKYFGLASTHGVKSPDNSDPGRGKFLDLIDLQEGTYVRRVILPTTTSIYITTDSFYFFQLSSKDDRNSGIFAPSKLPPEEVGAYRCLLEGQEILLSHDRRLGIEMTRGNVARVWSLDPLKKIQSLKGHSSVVSSARFSLDNTLVITSSKDTTVRVWGLSTGEQLSVFSLYGAMEMALFTPSTKFVVVHCYSAKQRKRVAAFRLHNVQHYLTE